jgi:hypothetical protein
MEEIAQCINNNITTIVAHPTPGRSKESVTQPNICSSISVQQMTIPIHVPRRNLKTTEDGTVELSKAVISSRNTEHPLAKLSKTIYTSRTAGREIDRASMQGVEKK